MRIPLMRVALLALCPAATVAQQGPPVRPLGAIVATAHADLGLRISVRALSDGRLMVNDIDHHRVLLFDSTLQRTTVVMDSAGTAARAYGAQPGGMFAFPGDSTLFVDPVALAMVVIDANGTIARTMAPPPGPNIALLLSTPGASPAGIDGRGRLIFRGTVNPPASTSGGVDAAPPPYPTGPLMRFDAASHVVDTAAFVRISAAPPIKTTITATERTNLRVVVPLLDIDGWTVLHDGTLAIMREQDYHIDWVAPNGSITSSPKVPHDWIRLTDDDKASLHDSIQKGLDADPMSNGTTTTPGTGFKLIRITTVVDANQLPDYYPPIKANTMRGDFDSNVWIPPQSLHPLAGGPVYDVIGRQGVLLDRIQIPGGCTVEAFGPGVVYLSSREGTGLTVVRARIH
jgi:hypothetical protein